MKHILTITAFILWAVSNATAQAPAKNGPNITLVLPGKDNKDIKYTLSNFSYFINRNTEEKTPLLQQTQSAGVSITLKGDWNKAILQWIGDPSKGQDGKIIITRAGKTEREILFKKAYVLSASQGFYEGVDDEDNGNALSLTLQCTEINMNGTALKIDNKPYMPHEED